MLLYLWLSFTLAIYTWLVLISGLKTHRVADPLHSWYRIQYSVDTFWRYITLYDGQHWNRLGGFARQMDMIVQRWATNNRRTTERSPKPARDWRDAGHTQRSQRHIYALSEARMYVCTTKVSTSESESPAKPSFLGNVIWWKSDAQWSR